MREIFALEVAKFPLEIVNRLLDLLDLGLEVGSVKALPASFGVGAGEQRINLKFSDRLGEYVFALWASNIESDSVP